MQTVDEIAELLNRLQAETKLNSANLEKVLTGINSKLELITDENISSDLIKIYITELKNIIKDSNGDVLTKFVDVDEHLKFILEAAKNSAEQFKELATDIENNGFNFVTEISSLRDELKQGIQAEIGNFANISNSISELSENVSGLEKVLNENSKFNFENLKSLIQNSSLDFKNQFEKLEQEYLTIVTVQDFANFKQDFADFLQKILDNDSVLQLSFDANKEQINAIIQKMNTLDYNGDFKNIADSISEFKTLFQDNSKMNYQNIVDRINNLKTEIYSRLTDDAGNYELKYEKLSTDINDIAKNIDYLKDFSSKNSVEILENISKELAQTAENINESINSNCELNFGQLKVLLESAGNEIEDLKADFNQKNDTNVFSISNGFENIKASFDNTFSLLNTISEVPEKVLCEIRNLSADVDEFKNGIQSYISDCINRVFDSINEVSVKTDSISETENENTQSIKDELVLLSSDLKALISEGFSKAYENSQTQTSAVKSVSENISELKTLINEAFNGIKDYFDTLEKIRKDKNFEEKLSNLENTIIHTGEEYENKVELLQSKLSEFSKIIESNASDSDNKISSSFEEIIRLKDNLIIAHENIKSLKVLTEEKFADISAIIDAGVENIVFNTNAINEAVTNGLDFGENFVSVENKLETLQNAVSELKNENSLKNDDILNTFDEKISEMKGALTSLNTDISDALGYKAEEIIGAFENIKSELNNLTSFDFQNMENEIQTMLENSFEDFNNEVSVGLSENSASIAGIEVLFKDTLNKLSIIEECVSEKLQNNIQLLNIELDKDVKDIKSSLEDKFSNTLNSFSKSNEELSSLISALRQEFSSKLDDLFSAGNKLNENNSLINNNLNSLSQELKNYIVSASQTVIEKLSNTGTDETLNLISQKLDIIAADSISEQMHERFDEMEVKGNETLNSLGLLSGSLEKLSDDNEVLNGLISNLDGKLDKFCEENVKTNIYVNALNDKFDDVSRNSDKTNLSVNELNEKLEKISFNSDKTVSCIENLEEKFACIPEHSDDKNEFGEKLENISNSNVQIAEILSALNTKVDVLSSDETVLNLYDEIDDLKDIIFEQRKYFESVSDEKSEAIDKYLRDVLMKLENVDLEKNAENIKERIISAIKTFAENISFVEESDDIKDFVEEKTDEIRYNLEEVQKQIKLLSNPVDDFDYTYSLQDVESDIAKLRLAINNIPAMNFEDLSEDVKIILNSVETLENNLPHDKITDLKTEIEKLSDDIISVSSRTNKILLSTDETYKDVQDNLINFSNMLYELQEKFEHLGSIDELKNIERKIDYLHSMALEASNADKMFHKVMMYLGEWIDSTTGNISSISDKTSQIEQIQNNLDELKSAIPSQSEIVEGVKEIVSDNTALFEELKNMLPDNSKIINCLEAKFEMQEERIDRLEAQLEKVLDKLEEKDNKAVSRKIDKIEKMLSGFSASIEKLASYVDE